MRLSEAIRLGALLKPQGYGIVPFNSGDPSSLATCALGAARQAINDRHSLLTNLWPVCLLVFPCPAPGCSRPYADNVADTIVHLNNAHRWTREAIADWITTVELQETLAQVKEQEATHATK